MTPNRSRHITLSWILALAILALPQASLLAQDSGETFFETLEVNVVNVDVYVTDRDGKPVHGLTKDDFVVHEDGKPVEITNFFAAEGGAIDGEAQAAPAPAAPTTPAAAQAAADQVPPEQRLHLAIFVDNRNLTARARNQSLKVLREFVRNQVRDQDRVLVVSYGGPGTLEVRKPPAGDREGLIKLLEEVASSAAVGSSVSSERADVIRDLERGLAYSEPNTPEDQQMDPMAADVARADAAGLYSRIQLYAQTQYDQTRTSLNTLGQFIDSLGGLPGRKAVVYLSGGHPLRPAQALFDAWARKYQGLDRDMRLGSVQLEGNSLDATPLFEKLAARANANRVTLYSLGGDDAMPGLSAEVGTAMAWTPAEAKQEALSRGQSLTMLSAATGGVSSVGNANPQAMLERLRHDMESYYSLGYNPSQRKTGKDHRIKVAVKNKDYKLRYRESYRDRTAQERMGEQTLSALILGEQDNPLNLAVEFEQEAKKGKDLQVTLLVKFPMAGLVLLPQEKFHEGRVTLFVGAKDDKGRVSDLTQIAIPIRVPNEQVLTAMGQTVAYRTSLVLRPLAHTVAVGIRDELGNVGSAVTADYTPGQAPGQVAENAGR